jgi:hypothetical protein
VKVAVTIALGITAVVGGAKSGAEIVRNLNGWHVLFLASCFVLAALGFDFCKQWAERKFADVRKEVQTAISKEETDRTVWVKHVQGQYNELRVKVETMEAEQESPPVE